MNRPSLEHVLDGGLGLCHLPDGLLVQVHLAGRRRPGAAGQRGLPVSVSGPVDHHQPLQPRVVPERLELGLDPGRPALILVGWVVIQ